MGIDWKTGGLVLLLLPGIYFGCMVYRLPDGKAWHDWAKNILNFLIFMTIFFPFAVALFVPVIRDWWIAERADLHIWPHYCILIALLLLAIHAASEDILRQPLEPFYYRRCDKLREAESSIREQISSLSKSLAVSRSIIVDKKRMGEFWSAETASFQKRLEGLTKISAALNGQSRKAMEEQIQREAQLWHQRNGLVQKNVRELWQKIRRYKLQIGREESEVLEEDLLLEGESANSIDHLLKRKSWFSAVSFGIHLVIAFIIAIIFWYFVVSSGKHLAMNAQRLATVMALLYFWFPFRFYKEWYTEFYSVSFRHFHGFSFVLLAATFSFFLFYLKEDQQILKGLSVSVVAILGVMGIVERIRPEWFYDGIFPFIADTRILRLICWGLLLAVTILAITLALNSSPKLRTPAAAVPGQIF